MANFSEANEDGFIHPSSKRQRFSSGGSSNSTHVNPETQHQENGDQETQPTENGDEGIHVQENGNPEARQLQESGNQEAQQHGENGNQVTFEENDDDDCEREGREANERLVSLRNSFLADESVSVTFMELDVLDCPVCCDPLTIPVFQCENGHTACSTCSNKLAHKCPTCSLPIGQNRCRAIEMILESVRIPCQNLRYGCKETVTYSKKYDHDKTCLFVSCCCPVKDCSFIGSTRRLDPHLRVAHVGDVIGIQYGETHSLPITGDEVIVLQEEEGGEIFVVTHREDIITISFLGPSSMGEYFYEISTDPELSPQIEGRHFRFQSYTKSIQRKDDKPSSAGFYLPRSDFYHSPEQLLYLKVIIRRKGDPLNFPKRVDDDDFDTAAYV